MSRSGWSVLFVALLLGSQVQGEWSFRRGDCNADGALDVSDAVALLEELFLGAPPWPCADACDANDDGAKNIADGVWVLTYLFSGGEEPPEPFGSCGSDPTDDGLDCVGPVAGCADVSGPSTEWYSPFSLLAAAPYPAGFVPVDPPGVGQNSPYPGLHPFSGELVHREVDLRIRGRGLDFVWTRTFRSSAPTDGLLGNGWDHSYNLRIETAGSDIRLYAGGGRVEFLGEQSDGRYGSDGLFHTGDFTPDGRFVVDFPNGGKWTFANPSSDGGAAAGKIESIEDRHGNAIQFSYDSEGRLNTIADTLDRLIEVSYGTNDRIVALTDFTGRVVSYSYHSASADTNEGDLASATGPPVVGTPHGNNFPLGKTASYQYSTHPTEPALVGNLTRITWPRGNARTFEFGTSGESFDKLIVVAVEGQDEALHFDYTPNPFEEPEAVSRVTSNDELGRVRALYYDEGKRCVAERSYTGFADPISPSSLFGAGWLNPPVDPLRDSDPEFFETRFEWNADSRLTRTIHPRGNITENVYELALDASAPRAERGNLRVRRRLPGGLATAGIPELVESFEYLPGYGGAQAAAFITQHTDRRGNTTVHSYDAAANRIETIHRIASSVESWEYNAFGQVTAHVHPNRELAPAVERRRDEFAYYDSGFQRGYRSAEVIDAEGEAITTGYGYDPRGNLVQLTDPRGGVTDFVVNALDQRVQLSRPELGFGERHHRFFHYDENDNRVRIDQARIDENGEWNPDDAYRTEIHEFDSRDQCVAVVREFGTDPLPLSQLDGAGLGPNHWTRTEYERDAAGQVVTVRHPEAVAGGQAENQVSLVLDERGLPYRRIQALAPGSVVGEFDYDPNGNRVSETVDPDGANPRITTHGYDGYDRRLTTTDAMGNLRQTFRDPNGNVVLRQLHGELTDLPGAGGNQLLFEASYEFDAMDRLVVENVLAFDPATGGSLLDGQVTQSYQYTDASLLVASTDDLGRVTARRYDGAHRLEEMTLPDGSGVDLQYDPASNLVVRTSTDQPSLGGAPTEHVENFVYDAFQRRTAEFDPLDQVTEYRYDWQDRVVRRIDALGNVVGTTFDGLGRVVLIEKELTTTGDGSGAVFDTMVMSKEWDLSSRLIAETDNLGHTTTTSYNGLNLPVLRTAPDGSAESWAYDVFGDVLERVDRNGTTLAVTRDALGRPIGHEILPGPDVSPQTTFETFSYDGLSRLTQSSNDNSLFTRRYDSWGNQIEESWPALGATMLYAYDGLGNCVSKVYPGGRVLSLTYDVLDRISEISDAEGAIVEYEYAGPGRVAQRDFRNSVRQSVDYDLDRRVSEVTYERDPGGPGAAEVDRRTYLWDAVDNLVERKDETSDFGSPRWRHLYEYDSLYQLVESRRLDSSFGITLAETDYVLGNVGNREEVISNGMSTDYERVSTPPALDFQVHQYTAVGNEARSFDDAGNLVTVQPVGAAPTVQRTFDFRNRMVGHFDVLANRVVSYEYDTVGRRIQQKVVTIGLSAVLEVETHYLFDGWQRIEERDDTGSTTATWVFGHGADAVVHQQRSDLPGQDITPLTDVLGNVIALTVEGSGSPVERVEYDDYGSPSFFDGSWNALAITSSAWENPLLFTGRPWEPHTGLYDFRHRDLDPQTGRFISVDPLGTWGDSTHHGNARSYAGNNPWSRVDPWGLASVPVVPAAQTAAAMNAPGSTVAFNPQPEPPAKALVSGWSAPGSRVAFNPQPEPPAATLVASGWSAPGSWVAFNPQPEPPAATRVASGWSAPGSHVAFNPQPEPPAKTLVSGWSVPGSWVAFNPQPEPPAKLLVSGWSAPGSRVAFNPQPEPPAKTLVSGWSVPGSRVAFNPQPEPPAKTLVSGWSAPGSRVAFNPQPEPPAVTLMASGWSAPGSRVAFNPQPEPPAVSETWGVGAQIHPPDPGLVGAGVVGP